MVIRQELQNGKGYTESTAVVVVFPPSTLAVHFREEIHCNDLK